MKSYVLDTNVFLADPLAIYSFPGSNVLIPDTVLSELDRLKTSKMDKRLRFRGREVSRILFGLSERGMLMEGIPIDDGSTVRVVALDSSTSIPPVLNPKNTDDRILAVAHQEAESGTDVTLVTNDLNMLLKAQTLDLPVVRYGEDDERGFGSRMLQTVKRNRAVVAAVVVGIAALVLALYALRVTTERNNAQPSAFPGEGTSSFQTQEFAYQQALGRNPRDFSALTGLANLYFDAGKTSGSSTRFEQATQYYRRALQIQSDNADVRTDLAISYFYLGDVDQAIAEAKASLKHNPKHPLTHYNLGVFYWKGKKDAVNAVREFEAAIRDDKVGQVASQSRELLQEIRVQQRQGGK